MVCPAFCMFHNVSPSLPVIRPSATCIQEGHFHLLHWSILIGNTKQVLQPRSLPGWPVCLGFPWWWTKWAKNNISSINTRTWIWYWFIEAKILYNGLHLTVNLLIWTIVNMFSDKFWHFSQVHGATPLGRLLSGRQQLARHASLCGLNVKSSVRCCSTRLVPAQSGDDLHTKSGVGVPWKYKSVFPIGSGWTGLHAIRSSTHAFPWGKKNIKNPILKGSTSFEAATRRPFKSFQLKIYSTYKNTAKFHALSGAVIDAISWTCYPIYCVHGAEKSKSTPAPGLGT